MSEKTLIELSNIRDGDILRLTAYADWKLSIYFKGQKVPEGLEGVDFISMLFERILDGRRNWDESKNATFYDFLKSSLGSIIHAFKKHHLRLKAELDGLDDPNVYVERLSDCAYFWDEEDIPLLEKYFKNKLSKKPDLLRLFTLKMNKYSIREIADEMKIEEKQVNNLTKRLRRIIRVEWIQLLEKLELGYEWK